MGLGFRRDGVFCVGQLVRASSSISLTPRPEQCPRQHCLLRWHSWIWTTGVGRNATTTRAHFHRRDAPLKKDLISVLSSFTRCLLGALSDSSTLHIMRWLWRMSRMTRFWQTVSVPGPVLKELQALPRARLLKPSALPVKPRRSQQARRRAGSPQSFQVR